LLVDVSFSLTVVTEDMVGANLELLHEAVEHLVALQFLLVLANLIEHSRAELQILVGMRQLNELTHNWEEDSFEAVVLAQVIQK